MNNRKFTQNEYKKSIPDILDLFEREILPRSAKGRADRIEQGRSSFWFFFREYLPHYAEQESPTFHKEIIDTLESESNRISICAPRGFSKSTLVSFAYVIWCVLREKYKFIVLVSSTDDLAEDLADFIRLEFTDNKRILEDFGSLLIGIGSAGDFTVNKTRILARGRKQAIRGFRYRQHRPDLIILDDIEKDEDGMSPSVVAKTLETITRGLIPSLSTKGKLVLIGTILRTRSVTGTLLLSEDEPWNLWTRKIYRAIEPTGDGSEQSLWKERFPLEFLQEQLSIMGRSAFNAEYQNMPSDEEHALFTESMIIDGTNPFHSPCVMFIDPSVDGIKKNDYKACVLVSKDEDHYNIEGAVLVQGSDNKFFEGVCDLFKKYQDRILGTYCEANGFQIYFMRDLDRFARERKLNLSLSSIKNTLKKEHRIAQLVPLFETGRMSFDRDFRKSREGKILVDQLLSFPNSKVHDDAPDALAGAVKVLESKTSVGGFTVLPKIRRRLRHFRGF
ncbi:MAG: hypothetical protein ACRCWI_02215 [Brevinema sp.]